MLLRRRCELEKDAVLFELVELRGHVHSHFDRRRIDAELLSWPIARIMTKGPKSIRRNALAAEALALMNTCSITVLFVIEDGKPVGAVHLHDCLRAGVA